MGSPSAHELPEVLKMIWTHLWNCGYVLGWGVMTIVSRINIMLLLTVLSYWAGLGWEATNGLVVTPIWKCKRVCSLRVERQSSS
jgi:hypothetical protein